jgi:hypothetical protein
MVEANSRLLLAALLHRTDEFTWVAKDHRRDEECFFISIINRCCGGRK